jgi:hypothetical protein
MAAAGMERPTTYELTIIYLAWKLKVTISDLYARDPFLVWVL